MTVHAFPVWKENATAAERLSELAALAREHPERFAQFVLVAREEIPDSKNFRVKHVSFGCDTVMGIFGLLDLGRFDVWNTSGGATE